MKFKTSGKKGYRFLSLVDGLEIASGINVDVIIEDADAPYGVLAVYTQKRRAFSEHDVSFLQVVANLIGGSFSIEEFSERSITGTCGTCIFAMENPNRAVAN